MLMPFKWYQTYVWYLLKRGTTWNELKRPETTYKEHRSTWNDLQRARNDLKWPTTSKAQPTMTWTYLQRAKKRCETTSNNRFSDYFSIWGKRFSSLTRFPPNIRFQSFEHCFKEKQSVKHLLSSVKSQLSCVFFNGYKSYFFLLGFCVSRERERLFI